MPIGIQLLQHTVYRYRGLVWVDDIDSVWIIIATPFIQIEITVLYSDSTFGYIQVFLVSTSKVYAGMKHKRKLQVYANEMYMIYDMIRET